MCGLTHQNESERNDRGCPAPAERWRGGQRQGRGGGGGRGRGGARGGGGGGWGRPPGGGGGGRGRGLLARRRGPDAGAQPGAIATATRSPSMPSTTTCSL